MECDGGAAPVTEPSAASLLQVAAQAAGKSHKAAEAAPGHMLPMVEGIFYAMGPAAIIAAVASWLYWRFARSASQSLPPP